jgi:DNA-binding transcriptional MerR regulator
MDWSIQEIARIAGTTSRTLRHYDDVGLVRPTRVGANGYRYYDRAALVRLQRVLMLRELGLGIPAISDALAGQPNDVNALHGHLRWLHDEKDRLDRQIASLRSTIRQWEGGETVMAEEMFDGFKHTQYRSEVEERWGADAYSSSASWWESMSTDQRKSWQGAQLQLAADWTAAATAGLDPSGADAQALAHRQADWLAAIPGTPGAGAGKPAKAYFLGLAEMYVADERFAANYGGVAGASFVRDAMTAYAEKNL